MKTRQILLGAGLLGAAALLLLDRPETVEASIAAPITVSAGTRASTPGPAPQVQLARLIERDQLIGDDSRFGQGGRALFAGHDWTPPPPPPKPLPPPPPAPPSAPALPYTYIGKSFQDGVWEVFLTRGEQIHLVRSGALLDASYRVDAIAPPLLTLTYLPLNQVQQMHIGAFE